MLAETVLAGLLMASGAAAGCTKGGPHPGVVIQQCSKPGMLALAYDDGPYIYTSDLVDILDAAGAKATFFFTGTLYGCIYDQATAVKKAFKSGHQVASHTWTHPALSGLTEDGIRSEMTQVEDALVNIIGKKPAYMRPPYLDTAGQTLPVLKSMGYKVITVDVDSGDWNKNTPEQSEAVFLAAGPGGNGHIPLMHEPYNTTVHELTPWLINWAKENKLRLVTVAECLGDAGGEYQKGKFEPNGKTTC